MYILSEILAVVAEVYTIHLFMLGSFYKRDRTILTWIFAYGLFGVLFVFLAFIPNGSYIRLLFCVVALVLINLSLFETTLLALFNAIIASLYISNIIGDHIWITTYLTGFISAGILILIVVLTRNEDQNENLL